jgi:precorrin-6x reductase
MSDIIIFGGTTEGRELAEWAADQGILTLVSVATGYGSQVIGEHQNLTVHEGRLDEPAMEVLFAQERPRLVLDATHPHAAEVTGIIRRACIHAQLPYLRVLREQEVSAPAGDAKQIRVETAQDAADLLKGDQEKIFLTTGSKELHTFATDPAIRERIYARVLPTSSVIAMCEEEGLQGRQILAMQGPFSTDMNVAMLKATGAGWLVTKESGAKGGYPEKLEAAAICGVKTVIIGRPMEETGISVEEAKQELRRLTGRNILQISLIGMGMGQGSQMTQESLDAIRQSDTVFGAPRMLEDLAAYTSGKTVAGLYMGQDICAYLVEHPQSRNVSVIYSGDTGYHSGSRSMILAIREHWKNELQNGTVKLRVYPGISTVSALCARFQTDWSGLYLASAHGQDCDVITLLEKHNRIFLLLGGEHPVRELCRELTAQGLGQSIRVMAGIRLGYPDEQLLDAFAGQLTQVQTDSLAAVILEKIASEGSSYER